MPVNKLRFWLQTTKCETKQFNLGAYEPLGAEQAIDFQVYELLGMHWGIQIIRVNSETNTKWIRMAI